MTIETEFSDHHKMTETVLKSYFKKKELIKINYHCSKNFNENLFRIELINVLQNSHVLDFEEFKKEVAEKLNKVFIEAVENLDIETYLAGNMDEALPETLQEIMDKYDNHTSIRKKENVIEVNS